MRKQLILLSILNITISIITCGQNDSLNTPPVPQVEEVFQVVEKEKIYPDIPACVEIADPKLKNQCFIDELVTLMYINLEYPPLALEHKIEGKVFITIDIDTDSNIYCIKGLRDIGGGTTKEAMRVAKIALEELLPHYKQCKWKPAKARGNPVRQLLMIPINFCL